MFTAYHYCTDAWKSIEHATTANAEERYTEVLFRSLSRPDNMQDTVRDLQSVYESFIRSSKARTWPDDIDQSIMLLYVHGLLISIEADYPGCLNA